MQAKAFATLGGLMLLPIALSACPSSVSTGDDDSSGGGSTSGQTSSTATSSSSTTGGACVVAADCPGTPPDCQVNTCDAGTCATAPQPQGFEATMQVAGDCRLVVCDGAGSKMAVADDADVLDDRLACTADVCSNGMPENNALAAGTPCDRNGGAVCDGAGACVECIQGSDCRTGHCQENICVPATCVDGVKDGDETDVDCGGSCTACADGLGCQSGDDCQSGVCAGSTCAAPSCGDQIENGAETDVDCGGATCSACGPGASCAVDSDCVGGACSGSLCLPTCTDGVLNAYETDVDCGGIDCGGCADGNACILDADCASGVCSSGVCQAPQCDDGVKNGTEPDVDCGGGCPFACPSGASCLTALDCESGVCSGGLCQAPQCNDGVENGSETDVDCGGGCPGCAKGQGCGGNADCSSGRCSSGSCADRLLISEVRTRGSAGLNDEFIELYNPSSTDAVVVDGSWTIKARGASGPSSCTGTENTRFTGAGQTVPPRGHLLIAAGSYDDGVPPDATYPNGVVDAGQLVLRQDDTIMDAVCFYFDSQTFATLTNPTCNYVCEGTPVSNLPHDNGLSPAGNTDVSIERKPGGLLGNGTDTDDNAADFVSAVPSSPQNQTSASTP